MTKKETKVQKPKCSAQTAKDGHGQNNATGGTCQKCDSTNRGHG